MLLLLFYHQMFCPRIGVAGSDLTHTWSKAVVGILAFSLSTLMKSHYQPLIALEKQGRLLHCHCWHDQLEGMLPVSPQKSSFHLKWKKRESLNQRTVCFLISFLWKWMWNKCSKLTALCISVFETVESHFNTSGCHCGIISPPKFPQDWEETRLINIERNGAALINAHV